jgi:hypothetical protein
VAQTLVQEQFETQKNQRDSLNEILV